MILYDALGNRYLVAPIGSTLDGSEARTLCARHGSDGVLLGRRAPNGTFPLTIFNTDGGTAENSGNGTRIFARSLRDQGILGSEKFCTVVPPAGPVLCTLHGDGTVEAALGCPVLDVAPRRYSVFNKPIFGHVVSLGNPHFVATVPSFPDRWLEIACELASSSAFPSGTNVEFLQILGRRSIALRIYERGVGRTSSCGSGAACAAAVAARFFGIGPSMAVTMEGGILSVTVAATGIHIRGPVIRIIPPAE